MKITHSAVIVHNSQLIVRKNHGEEKVVRFITPVVGVAFPPGSADGTGGGCPMMTVGDIKRLQLFQSLPQIPDFRGLAHNPHRMDNSVISGKVVFGGAGFKAFNQTIETFR